MTPEHSERLKQRVQARQAAEAAMDLYVRPESAGFTQDAFWAACRDYCMLKAPLPPGSAVARATAMEDWDVKNFELTTMPFGQHAGELMRDVPLKYLDWLVGVGEDDIKARAARHLARPDVQARLREETGEE